MDHRRFHIIIKTFYQNYVYVYVCSKLLKAPLMITSNKYLARGFSTLLPLKTDFNKIFLGYVSIGIPKLSKENTIYSTPREYLTLHGALALSPSSTRADTVYTTAAS